MCKKSLEIVQKIFKEEVIKKITQNELKQSFQLMRLVELAHWKYLDDYYDNNNKLVKYDLASFTRIVLPYHEKDLVKKYKEYVNTLKVCGCVFFNEDLTQCLCVRPAMGQWSFPKGKIQCNETDEQCAAREVYEEIGYNVAIDKLKIKPWIEVNDLVNHKKNWRQTKLFIFVNEELKNLATNSAKEVKEIKWINFQQIPHNYKNPGLHPKLFYELRSLIRFKKELLNKIKHR